MRWEQDNDLTCLGPLGLFQEYLSMGMILPRFLRPAYRAVSRHTATAPASGVEAVVRSPTNMAAAEIAAVDFNRMTSK